MPDRADRVGCSSRPGLTRAGWLHRRPAVLAATLLAVLAAATTALGAKIEIGPAHQVEYVGHDWPGQVSLGYESYSELAHFRPGPPVINGVRFATTCAGATNFRGKITVHDGRFAYEGGGVTISGHLIGSVTAPREIAGVVSVTASGCSSGPWWFGVYP